MHLNSTRFCSFLCRGPNQGRLDKPATFCKQRTHCFTVHDEYSKVLIPTIFRGDTLRKVGKFDSINQITHAPSKFATVYISLYGIHCSSVLPGFQRKYFHMSIKFIKHVSRRSEEVVNTTMNYFPLQKFYSECSPISAIPYNVFVGTVSTS